MGYCCGYEILHTLDLNTPDNSTGNESNLRYYADYTIYLAGNRIYQGRVYSAVNSPSQTVDIDIAPVCRNYIDTNWEAAGLFDPASNEEIVYNYNVWPSYAIASFDVRDASGTNTLGTYLVEYDYNTDYVSQKSTPRIINDRVMYTVDVRQLIFHSAVGQQRVIVENNGSRLQDVTSTSIIPTFNTIVSRLKKMAVSAGDTLEIAQYVPNTLWPIRYKFKIVESCKYNYCLYYVNEFGGVDYLLCRGRSVETHNYTHNDIRRFHKPSSRTDWDQKRLSSEIRNRYRLSISDIPDIPDYATSNPYPLSPPPKDLYSKRMKHFFGSPKVWLHDLEADTITSVIITDNSYQTLERRYDRLYTYTVNVEESQIFERR